MLLHLEAVRVWLLNRSSRVLRPAAAEERLRGTARGDSSSRSVYTDSGPTSRSAVPPTPAAPHEMILTRCSRYPAD